MDQLNHNPDRRTFLKASLLAGGGLLISFTWPGSKSFAQVLNAGASPAEWSELTGYIKISPDNLIKILNPNPEFGQNVMTSLPMIVAEELDADWKKVIVEMGPHDGIGIKNVTRITYLDILRGLFSFKDAKTYLFFNRNENGRRSAKEFLRRLNERKENRDKRMKIGNFQRQLKAIHSWGKQPPQDLSVIKQPVLVANGDNDRMVPSKNTIDLNKRLPNSEIIMYKDAGHGGIFQYHEEFVKSALAFLTK